jgi:hypothetical protein
MDRLLIGGVMIMTVAVIALTVFAIIVVAAAK